MTMPIWIPGEEPPSDAEIVTSYWKAQAEYFAQAHHERLAEYDGLTLLLSTTLGDDWREKLERRAMRDRRK